MSAHDNSSPIAHRPPTPEEMVGIEQAVRSGNHVLATRLAGEAAAKGAEHFVLLTLAVHDSLRRGTVDEAIAYGLRARALSPRDPAVLNAYGLALLEGGRAREAIAAFDAALRASPGQAELHCNKGCAYEELRDDARARVCFERTLAINPDHVQALVRSAFIAAMSGDLAQARANASRALRFRPGEPTATLALAQADLEDKAFEAVVARLMPLRRGPANLNRTIAEGMTADALDGLGRHDEAFRAYGASNAMRRALAAPRFATGENARAKAERLAAYFKARESWPAAASGDNGRTHVFLIGFPRSGTTLLEQVLAAHPGVNSMEERDCLDDSIREFETTAEGLDRFAALTDEELEPWRAAYWRHVGEWGVDAKGPVFLDKLPLNVVHLGLIARLFPAAKFLFALRDPADVVWSCFRRRFGLTTAMYELLTLEDAARYYDAVMSLAAVYRKKLGLAVHELRYEVMVQDFEGETRRLCAFLGLEWRPELADFAAKTRARAVNTPSAAQVTRGLYATAIGQWTAYCEQLAPVLPILAPWRERFGYA